MHDQHAATELPSVRRQKILLLLERDGKVMASELSQHFAVSEDTIRRDLSELASAGLVQRVHGGALPVLYSTFCSVYWQANEGQVAQLVEHTTENRSVGGSIPSLATT